VAAGSTKVVIAALLGNAAIATTKYAAAAVTGSSAMFAEAVHSTVDTGNQVLLLVGLRRAARPADPRHPFGHGKELYFWAFVVAVLLFGIGAGVSIYEGFLKLSDPHPITAVGWNYLVIAAAALFEAGAWIVAWREFDRERGGAPILKALRASKDPALFTVIFEDSAALLGLLAAFLGVLASDRLGWLWADAAATLVIGGILACAAVLLAIETKSLLVGEAASPKLVEDIIGAAGRAPFVEAVNEARTIHFGPDDVLVNLSVDARDAMTAGEVERGISALEDEIKARHPEVSRVFVEIQAAKASAAEIAEGDTGAEASAGGAESDARGA
jgi:cation diffusion facilitator family transporter